ncbi:MAG: tetratricopeptide repeat protein, partial [Thermodesulfobacteriota bacterium]
YPLPKGATEQLFMERELSSVISLLHENREGMEFSYPHRLLGLLLGEYEGKEQRVRAVEELQKAVAAPGGDSFTYYDLGLTLGRLSRYDEAIAAFQTSIRMNKAFKQSYLALGLMYFDNKNYEDSAQVLERYVRFADDNAEYPGLKTLGRSCFKLGRLHCAEDAFKRAEFIADDDKKQGEAAYYLGNTYFEEGRLEEGAEAYGRALDRDASYKKVFLNLNKMLSFKKEHRKAAAIEGILKRERKKD